MSRLGRNEPCHCGSSKKYKRCCLPADEAAKLAALRADREAVEAGVRALLEQGPPLDGWTPEDEQDDVDFVNDSNAVVDLIHAGRFDEADRAARDLIVRYPFATDGLERLGHVSEAQGDLKTAAKLYREALAQAEDLGIADQEHYDTLRALADRIDPPPSLAEIAEGL